MKGALVAAFMALALTGCGLEIIPYLLPPGDTADASPGTPTFRAQNQATTVVEFRGFELYYKFYSSEQSLQIGFGTRDQLVAYGFRRMNSPGTASDQFKPLIDVDVADRNSDFTTEIYFGDRESSPPDATYGGAVPRTIEIARIATDLSGSYKTFQQSELEQGDLDMATVTWTGSGQTLSVVVYAVSYGVLDYSTDIYSDARYLGYVEYYFP